jgi:hypothetical protein
MPPDGFAHVHSLKLLVWGRESAVCAGHQMKRFVNVVLLGGRLGADWRDGG